MIFPSVATWTIPLGTVIFCSLPVNATPLIEVIFKVSPASLSLTTESKSIFVLLPLSTLRLKSVAVGAVFKTTKER